MPPSSGSSMRSPSWRSRKGLCMGDLRSGQVADVFDQGCEMGFVLHLFQPAPEPDEAQARQGRPERSLRDRPGGIQILDVDVELRVDEEQVAARIEDGIGVDLRGGGGDELVLIDAFLLDVAPSL